MEALSCLPKDMIEISDLSLEIAKSKVTRFCREVIGPELPASGSIPRDST